MVTPHQPAPPPRRTEQDIARRHDLMNAASGALGDTVRVVAPRAGGARLTQAQRDGRACISCQGTAGLREGGHVTDGGLGYAVKVCRSCPPYAAVLADAEEPGR